MRICGPQVRFSGALASYGIDELWLYSQRFESLMDKLGANTLYDYPREQFDNISEDDGYYNVPNEPTQDSRDESSVLLALVQPDGALRKVKDLNGYEEQTLC